MLLFILVLLAALAFEYINGFHDAANAIATVVSTKVLTPRQAIALAAGFNLIGAFMGTAVAKTIGAGQVDVKVVTMGTVLAALIGAIIWNLITWWFGIPSSSSHALIGGLCGAALATSHGEWSVLVWSHAGKGLWPQIIVPMFSSPVAGFAIGFLLMALLTIALVRVRPRIVNAVFGRLQVVSAAWMGLSHGTNDAQKTMGIIALALFTGTTQGAFEDLPPWLDFLQTPTFEIHPWVIVACALTMAAGTAAGGWRIIRTMGHKMVRLQPVHGFAAETTAGVVIQIASHLGIPLSTTHVISTSIMGVGAMKRFSAVKWGLVHRIVWAWVLTLPIAGGLGYITERCFLFFGLVK
jgi:PiT family inorganic phosphate transporter